jgi:hypothetical protein
MTTDEPSKAGPSSDASSALVLRAHGGPLADDVRMQQLWLQLQQRSWRTLAVVSASPGVATLAAANHLAKIAWWYTGQPTAVFDMRDLSLRLLEHQLRDMASQVGGAERVFIALRSTSENPTAVPLARAADAAVLCVELGKTTTKAAQKTLEAVGRGRFIGTILVSGDDDKVADSSPMDPPARDADGDADADDAKP